MPELVAIGDFSCFKPEKIFSITISVQEAQ